MLQQRARQAKSVFFVEKEKSTIKILEKNIEKLKVKKKAEIFFDDVFDQIKKQGVMSSKFDLIFCDPPFKDTDIEKLINLIFSKNLMSKNGIMILHRNKNTREKLPSCFRVIDERVYGVSKIIFGKFLS